MSIFPASQFFPRPLTAAVITCSPLIFLHGWVRQREKRMSQQVSTLQCKQEQLSLARTRVTSLSPPNSLYKSKALPALSMPCRVDTLSPSLHPFHLGKTSVWPWHVSAQTPLISAQSSLRTRAEAVGSHPIFSLSLSLSAAPSLPLAWDATWCHGMPQDATGCTARYRAGCMLLKCTAGRSHHSHHIHGEDISWHGLGKIWAI